MLGYFERVSLVGYSKRARQTSPPSCVSRRPSGDSALTILVLTFLFVAICISLCSLLFWWLPERYLSVSIRYSGFGLFSFCGPRIRFSASSREYSTRVSLLDLLRRFSKISMRFSVSFWVVSQISW